MTLQAINFSDSQANFVTSTKLTAMYDSKNPLSHRNSTYECSIWYTGRFEMKASTKIRKNNSQRHDLE